MKLRKFLVLFFFIFSLLQFPARAVSTSAGSAILIDAVTGTVLYEQNADIRRGIASTTKIMTGLLVSELCNLDDMVKVAPEAVGVEGTSLYLTAGQSLSVRELLYGMMLKSGNDAAAALAIHIAGSIDDFVRLMNDRAKSLHMSGSHFVNPHGLPSENHYSTARDMAVLTREALRNLIFSDVVGTKYYKAAGITVKNHNRLLWSYEGADGVKTGYTKKAGRCLVSSATRNGQRLIAVTLQDGDDWKDHAALFDYGFDNYTLLQYYKAGETLAECPVYNGTIPKVSARAVEDVALLLPKDDAERVSVRIFLPKYIWETVNEGHILGRLQIALEDTILYDGPILAGETAIQRNAEPFWHRVLPFV